VTGVAWEVGVSMTRDYPVMRRTIWLVTT